MPRFTHKEILSKKETAFFLKLRKAFPNHYIFVQVSFNALIEVKNDSSWKTRSQFNRLVADYVLYDSVRMEISAIVELDDWTHSYKEEKDAQRDLMLIEAGYRIIRIPSADISIEDLQTRILLDSDNSSTGL